MKNYKNIDSNVLAGGIFHRQTSKLFISSYIIMLKAYILLNIPFLFIHKDKYFAYTSSIYKNQKAFSRATLFFPQNKINSLRCPNNAIFTSISNSHKFPMIFFLLLLLALMSKFKKTKNREKASWNFRPFSYYIQREFLFDFFYRYFLYLFQCLILKSISDL